MTKEELIIADLILKKMPFNQAVNFHPFVEGQLNMEAHNLDVEVRLNLQSINTRRIRTFLLEEGYIDPVNHVIPSDKLNEKGKQARDLGGHAQYKEWEKKKKRKERIEDFPKKKWYYYEPVRIIAGVIIGLLIGYAWGVYIGAQKNAIAPSQVKIAPTNLKPNHPTDSPVHPRVLNK